MTQIDKDQISNSLGSVVQNLNLSQQFYSAQVSQTDTMQINIRGYLVSNNRNLLNWLYVEHGIVQTLVDQPVDDAFRAGIEIKTDNLDADDQELLENHMERYEIIQRVAQAVKWGRLFGGSAIMLLTDQDYMKPFNVKLVTEKSRLDFRAVDMWELLKTEQPSQGELDPDETEFFHYYGRQIHRSYFFIFKGKEAPSLIRPMLRGWGMSEVERAVRSVNQYLKNQNVVFDLLDEAKIDVYKIEGMNTALMTPTGANQVTTRIQYANSIKSHQNAIVMDKEDEYDQKQMTFSGLSEILNQIRQSVAADLKMPMTKLFGLSSAGFNSGEDDIENYNSMVEGEVRAKVKFLMLDIIGICCQKLFGEVPPDLKLTFPPLRILGADQEETIKEKQFNRLLQAYDRGLADSTTFKAGANKESLLPVELDEAEEPELPDGAEDFDTPPISKGA